MTTATKLTDLETTALKGLSNGDDFEVETIGGDEISGVLGTWHDTGLDEKTAKGVMASLFKKDLISESGINEHFTYTVWFIANSTLDLVK